MTLSPLQISRLELRSTRTDSDFSDVGLPALPEVPGMISPAESRYLYWLTSKGFCGAGAVVEIGTWLGRSTTCMGAGLRDAGYFEALHCFDQFTWKKGHADKSDLSLQKGGSFRAEFEKNIRPIYPGVRVTEGAIQDLVWRNGQIEILFLDAPKRLDDISAVMASFAPSLVPDLSLIVLQDYLHEPSYALPVVLSCLTEGLELIHVVEGGTTVSFVVRKPLDYALAQPTIWNFENWETSDTRKAWDRILEPLPASARKRVELGMVFLLFDQGRIADACQLVRAKLDESARERWARYAQTHLYHRYRPLFKSLGIHPTLSVWQTVRSIKGRMRKALKKRLKGA